MDYKIYRLEFQGAVHFGKQNIETGECTCPADTIFSALCQEALRMGEDVLKEFYQYAKEGGLLFSDAFPYMGETYYLPKPIMRIEAGNGKGDSVLKKAYKKLKYIPMEMLDTYLKGTYDVLHAPDMEGLGHFEMKNVVSVRGEEETKPYRVGTYFYTSGNGIYVIVGYTEQKTLDLLEELWKGLSFSGIGGKRIAGLGRFRVQASEVPDDFRKRLEGDGKRYMSLSVSLPREEEMETSLRGAEYILCKRSGFVASEQYAMEQMRKRDLYVLKAGSCFNVKYCGDIYDVSDQRERHPVYRYAKPMFMEVDA